MGAVGRHGACEVPRATVYLDLETTGLYPPADAILEIAMVDHDGQVLLETLVRPEHVTSWPDAEALHGITPQDVENAPTLETLRPQLVEAVQGNTVVIYNAAFDRGFLEAELATPAEVRCCMIAFAEHYGEWSDWHGSYRWQSLSTAAAYVRHTWTGSAHRAVADALACRAVWRYLTEPEERQRVEAINADEQATWEAQAALRGWALADARTQQCEAARLTAWWTWWWLKRPPLEPHRPQDVRESAPGYRAQWETYAQVFTGDTLAVLEQVERAAALGLPGYRRQQDIPAHLKTDRSSSHPDGDLGACGPPGAGLLCLQERQALLVALRHAGRGGDTAAARAALYRSGARPPGDCHPTAPGAGATVAPRQSASGGGILPPHCSSVVSVVSAPPAPFRGRRGRGRNVYPCGTPSGSPLTVSPRVPGAGGREGH